MKKSVAFLLLVVLLVFPLASGCADIPRSYAKDQVILSEMSEELCLKFIASKGVVIPDEYKDSPHLGNIVKGIISEIEKNPYFFYTISYSVAANFAEQIGKAVNDYYAVKEKDITDKSKISFPREGWSLGMSSIPGLPISSDYDEALFFTDDGQFVIDGDKNIEFVGKSYVSTDAGTIFWVNIDPVLEGGLYLGRDVYVGVIAFEDEHIVGFSVINIYSYPELDMTQTAFSAKLIKSVAFEKINGQYQYITYNYVFNEIGRIIYGHQNG